MKLDFFTKLGLFKLDGEKPLGRRIYDSMVAAFGGQLSTDPGTLGDNFAAASALTAAEAQVAAERVFEQQLPDHVYELLPQKEEEYGLYPSPTDSIPTRRAALKARMLLPNGMTRINIENILKALLGSNFVGWRVTQPDERVMFPLALGDQPQNLVAADVPRILMTVVTHLSVGLGAPQYVQYDQVTPTAATVTIKIGDKLVIEPEIKARTEVVTVTDVTIDDLDRRWFQATFNREHEASCLATTMPFPVWTSSQRASLVVVKPAVVKDAETRRKIHEAMERVYRGVSTWGIAQEGATPHTVDALILDDASQGQLDINPLGSGTVPLP